MPHTFHVQIHEEMAREGASQRKASRFGRSGQAGNLKTGERLLSLDELHEKHEEVNRRNAELQAELARLKASKNGTTS